MALKDFVIPTKEISFPDGSTFAVRGLSLQDITTLLSRYGSEMEMFFQRYAGNDNVNPLAVGMDLLNQAPALLSTIIALAADEPDGGPIVARYPLNVQQEAIEAIAQLTFDAAGGPKKFIEAVARLIKGMTNLMPEPHPSTNGSQASGAK